MTLEYEELMEEVRRDEQQRKEREAKETKDRQEREALVKHLRTGYDRACNAYLEVLLERWELDGCYGFWNSDRPGTIYHYGETHNLSMEDIIYCVENGIDEDEVLAWEDYLLDANEFGFTLPNLPAWHSGCPRTDEATFERLRRMKQDLMDAVEEEKHRQDMEESGKSDAADTPDSEDAPDTEDQGATVV